MFSAIGIRLLDAWNILIGLETQYSSEDDELYFEGYRCEYAITIYIGIFAIDFVKIDDEKMEGF